MGPVMEQHPAAFGNLLCALDFALSGAFEIAVVGNPGEEETQALLREVFRRYLPNKVVVCGRDYEMHLLRGRKEIGGRPAAYVCRDNACRAPVTTAEDLAGQLESAVAKNRTPVPRPVE
jgi:uncharacterized protein YyaL (SSP411 family)